MMIKMKLTNPQFYSIDLMVTLKGKLLDGVVAMGFFVSKKTCGVGNGTTITFQRNNQKNVPFVEKHSDQMMVLTGILDQAMVNLTEDT